MESLWEQSNRCSNRQ